MKKNTLVIIACLVSIQSAFAQDIEYNKKKNKFMVGETPIAQLDSRKDNGWGFTRSFFLQDLQSKDMVNFLSESHKDTLFADFHTWYRVEIPSLSLTFQIPDAAELNNEKYFAKVVSENQLLGKDGKLNDAQCRAYAALNVFDFKTQYERYNDSLKKLVAVPKIIVERRHNKPVYADDLGRIGQGDIVIGHWEILMVPTTSFDHKPKKVFLIKNMNGGIIATLDGRNFTTFDKKRYEDMIMPNTELVQRTGERDIEYMTRVGTYMVGKNML